MSSALRIAILMLATCCAAATALAQPAPGAPPKSGAAAPPGAAAPVPADPWPRKLDLANASVLVYQPQINSWDGNQLDFRSAVEIQPVGAKQETFGVVFGKARTHVDRVARTVVLESLSLTKSDFPLLPDRGKAYAPELAVRVASGIRTISLDRMEAATTTGCAGSTGTAPNSKPSPTISCTTC